jgi:hypothetical protein
MLKRLILLFFVASTILGFILPLIALYEASVWLSTLSYKGSLDS